MRLSTALSLPLSLLSFNAVYASPYRDDLKDYNLNVNQDAQSPLEYKSDRPSNKWTPSPDNWRALPIYTILMDKFADGDPANNDYFGTQFENDYRETQLRYGGDLKGLVSRLDYLQGMGIKVIFISGTPFLNMLWQADSMFPCISCPLAFHSTIVLFQVTRHWILQFWTLIGALPMIGAMLLIRSTPGGCTSWLILPLVPCPT